MTKYDSLDPRTELEQTIAEDLKRALEKRNFKVQHNGTIGHNAPKNTPDITVYNDTIHINVEITKSVKSKQDKEWQSIKDHFEVTKKAHRTKKCFLWFISPETYYRTINSTKDWNFAHKKGNDQKFLPISFSTLELFVKKLTEASEEQYPQEQILGLFADFVQFIDDQTILRQFYEKLFSADEALKDKLQAREEERHQRVVQELIAGFKQLEQKLRDERVALSGEAIKNVIYLVFIKLYEEKKEKEEGQRNRFTSTSFQDYQANVRDTRTAVHKLFANIKNDPDLKASKLFTGEDHLSPRLKDRFVMEHFIKKFEEYAFYTTKVDGLGAAYEVLGALSGKDRTAGQFFTPEAVVTFMMKLADLHPSDVILDPACGTARFLTYAMHDMMAKVRGTRDEEKSIKHIQREQLFGTDDDPTVAKLAKMNMYINGDGKTNILDEDGLTQTRKDGKIDVILTNPPLGDLDYRRSIYSDDFRLKRMEVIPKRNLTEEKLAKVKQHITETQRKLGLSDLPVSESERLGKRISQLQQEKTELELDKRDGRSKYAASGRLMKGGALFLNACKHYMKERRDNSAPAEWRGGKVLIVLDEGILNTDGFKGFRNFIKREFFIKAIISLTKDTFIPVCRTMTKTSIMYAIRKADPNVTQKEPIFLAHVAKVGLNTRKKLCENHLFNFGNDILSKFMSFKAAVLSSYDGLTFSEVKFESAFKSGRLDYGVPELRPMRESLKTEPQDYERLFESNHYYIFPDRMESKRQRLDFVANHPMFAWVRSFRESKNVIPLNQIIDPERFSYGLSESGSESGKIGFLNVQHLTLEGRILFNPKTFLKGCAPEKKLVENDILIARTGHTLGKAALITKEYDGFAFGSFCIRFSLNTKDYLPDFIAQFINSAYGQAQIMLLKAGAGKNNINLDHIRDIMIPTVDRRQQEHILDNYRKSLNKLSELEIEQERLKEHLHEEFTEESFSKLG